MDILIPRKDYILKIDSRHICLRIIEKTRNSNNHINEVLSTYLDRTSHTAQEKSFINALVLGVIRMRGRSNYIIKSLYKGNFSKLKISMKDILGIGIYQIDSMNSVPDYAAISSSVNLTKKRFPGFEKIANAILREYLRKKNTFAVSPSDKKTFPLLSHPNWLIDRWIENYGIKKTLEICNFNNSPQEIWFRSNLKIEMSRIEAEVNSLDIKIEVHPINKNFFQTDNPNRLIRSMIFKTGYISIQNPTNGFIVNLLSPKDEEEILDGCSAPGGKGTLISAMAPKAKITSVDNNDKRLDKLLEAIKRQGIKNIEVEVKNLETATFRKFDKILLDVPCTGTGVANRRTDLRWNRSEDDLNKITKIQYNILVNASKYLKKNGIIIYSTCSIEPEENERIIEKFLNNHNFIVEDAGDFVNNNIVRDNAIKLFPGEYNLDGGFAVRLKQI